MRDLYIHKTAIIDMVSHWRDEAIKTQIGGGTKVWHFCHICRGAHIGDDCVLGQNVYVGPGVRIGNRVHIQNNVSVYEGVTIGNDVFVGPSAVFTNVHLPNPRKKSEKFSEIHVRPGAMIGANATIIAPCTIGRNAVVGAGSVVTKDVPANAMVYGTPAKKRRME